MRKHIQKQYWWLVAVVMLIVGMTGCDQDNLSRPTTPELTDQKIVERPNPVQLANFYTGQGVSDEFGAYVGHEEFVIQVPAGEYLLTFCLFFRIEWYGMSLKDRAFQRIKTKNLQKFVGIEYVAPPTFTFTFTLNHKRRSYDAITHIIYGLLCLCLCQVISGGLL